MQLNITAHHIDVSQTLNEYIKEKMQKLKRHFDHIINVHVVLTINKLEQKAEGILHLSGNEIFADCVKDDMYAAIDGLADKLDKQIIKHKEKITSHR